MGSGGGQESESKTTKMSLSGEEKQLQGYQLEFVQQALDAFKHQSAYQNLQWGLGGQATGDLGGLQDPLSSLSSEQRAGLVQNYYDQAMSGSRRAEDLSGMAMDRIRSGGAATPEQLANIRAASEAELGAGLSDINRFAQSQRNDVATQLAPRLGLHRSDTPILDRGNRIGAEAINAAGNLVSDVRGREAQARLNYPLAANQAASSMSQAQQGIGYSRADVLADLNQQAFQNRLALTGQAGQQGLGLATGYNVPAAQQSLRPTTGQESSSFGWNSAIMSSSRAVKDIQGPASGTEMLERLKSLPVAFWRYKDGDDLGEHVGTFAEDFKAAFGIGDGQNLHLGDMAGVLLSSIQELAAEVEALRAEKES